MIFPVKFWYHFGIFVLDRVLSVNYPSLNGDSGAFGPLPVRKKKLNHRVPAWLPMTIRIQEERQEIVRLVKL
jgi:hypothetical protein